MTGIVNGMTGLGLVLVASLSVAGEASFFITSVGPGNGADLRGLRGADSHCQMLAESAGIGSASWHAYLSTSAAEGNASINARDRIGAGPWYNVGGTLVATNLEELHGDNNLTKQTVLTESGQMINGRGDTPNRHDILTGSNLDGIATDSTCDNWTSGDAGSAIAGHHDRTGGGANPTSWNSAHATRGCSQADLQGTGGDGLFYCFLTD